MSIDDIFHPDDKLLALIRHHARESADAVDEARAERTCTMGVGCGTSGKCYAEAMGSPEQCGRVRKRLVSTDKS